MAKESIMRMEPSGDCSTDIQKNFHILDKALFILMILSIFVFCLSLWNMWVMDTYPGAEYLFTNIFPPYTGILSGVITVVCIIAIIATNNLRKKVCGNDGMLYTLLG